MKHKHCDLIIAWADGAEIQEWYDGRWIDTDPSWYDYVEYRIKPEEKKPVVRWLWSYLTEGGVWTPSYFFYTDEEMAQIDEKVVKLEWSRTEFPE